MPLTQNELLYERYRIIHPIEQDTGGAVYLASDEPLSRLVTIKEVRDISESTRVQFEREASILARMLHPSLPRLIDQFMDKSGVQYLVMDYLEGENLHQILDRRGILPEKEVLEWIEQVMDALNYMHTGLGSPIIHRDIKPSNILRAQDNQIYLIDYGLAVVQSPEKTRTSTRFATPGFSPLEQYADGVDQRSDVYSLGATLYTLLTGVIPPEPIEIVAASSQLIPPHQLNSNITRVTENAILKAMQIRPVDRYQSIKELRTALWDRKHLAAPNANQSGQSLSETVLLPGSTFWLGQENDRGRNLPFVSEALTAIIAVIRYKDASTILLSVSMILFSILMFVISLFDGGIVLSPHLLITFCAGIIGLRLATNRGS